MSNSGKALRQAERIRTFWLQHGCNVNVRVEERKDDNSVIWFDIKSDMENGLPRYGNLDREKLFRSHQVALTVKTGEPAL